MSFDCALRHDMQHAMSLHEKLTSPHTARLTVDDFLVLDRSGAFDSYSKTELIDGRIIVVNAQYSEHMMAKVTMLRRLADACDALGGGLQAWSEGSIAMAPSSMPEPDLFITNQRPKSGPVQIETVVLIAEISDTSAKYDLGTKLHLYARAGVPEYWVVDLEAGKLHQMWSPAAKGYAEKREVALGERVESVTIAGLAVETGGV